jgi:hypothetical protein
MTGHPTLLNVAAAADASRHTARAITPARAAIGVEIAPPDQGDEVYGTKALCQPPAMGGTPRQREGHALFRTMTFADSRSYKRNYAPGAVCRLARVSKKIGDAAR